MRYKAVQCENKPMSRKKKHVSKDRHRKEAEEEFAGASEEFARRVGCVTENDLRLSRNSEQSILVQAFNKIAQAAARRKIN